MEKTIINFQENDDITNFFLLKEVSVMQNYKGEDYFQLTIKDNTGEYHAKFWNISETDKETFFPMNIVKIKGIVTKYGNLYLNIKKMRMAAEEDGKNLEDFIKSAPIQPIDLIESIQKTVNIIQIPTIQTIVQECLKRAGDKLMSYPAAMEYHHNFFAGLAYHIHRMLELAEFVCRHRPFLNRDLLIAGIILHDLGKLEELVVDLGVATDYSVRGRLLGHLGISVIRISQIAVEQGISPDDELVLALQHLVLSHHGSKEQGSPVHPQLPEAVALHFIDMLDSRLQPVEDALDESPAHEPFTKRIKANDRHAIYKLNSPIPNSI